MGVPMLRQPQGIVRLRPEFARFKGLGVVLGVSVDDIFGSSARIAYQNEPGQAASAHGLARRFESSRSTYATIAPSAGIVDFSLTQPFMIVCSFTLSVTNVATRILSYRQAAATSSTNGIQLGCAANGRLGYWFGNSSGQSSQAASNAVLVAHKPYTAVFGWDGSTHFLFLDGVRQTGSSPSTFATANTGTNTNINIGRRNTGSSYLDGTISLFAHMTGAFSLDEARALSSNPWSMFEDLGAEDERIILAAAPARTPVNKDLLLSYGVRQAAGKALSLAYGIRGAVGTGLTFSYGIRGAVGTGLTFSYSVRGAVGASLTLAYAVRQTAGQSLPFEYRIAGAVRTDLLINYAILGQAPADIFVPAHRTIEFAAAGREVAFDAQARTVTFDKTTNHSVEFAAQARTVEFVAQARTVEF